jgi:single-strand DNA-binding protein
MGRSLNKVMLRGNVGADPEIRRTQDGRPIANLRLATSENWKDKNTGERQEKTEWHTVICFNENLCDLIEKYVHKGSFIAVEGALTTRKWQGQDGLDRYSTEIVIQGFNGTVDLLDKAPSNRPPAADGADDYGYDGDRATGRSTRSATPPRSTAPNFARDMDDDIPF